MTADEEEAQRKAKNAARMREWRAKNPHSRLKEMSDPDYKAKSAQKMRKWRAHPLSPEMRAQENERIRQLRTANREKYREQQRAWREKNRRRRPKQGPSGTTAVGNIAVALRLSE